MNMQDLHYLHGAPVVSGVIRQQEEDFFVDETLSFEPSGEGEHLLLRVEKKGANTEWVARQLADFYNIPNKSVVWAGLKDRHAVTRQWFGLHIPGMKGDVSYPEHEEFRVLEHTFNNRKLRTGAIAHNSFRLVVRDLEGDLEQLEQRLTCIAETGVPNYFGEQRFGREGGNLDKARQWLLEGGRPRRSERSILLSTVRSYIFNSILSSRLERQAWLSVNEGDVVMLDNTHSVFTVAEAELLSTRERIQQGDCHPTIILPGSGRSRAKGEAEEREKAELETYVEWIDALSKERVEQSRRGVRLKPQDLQWNLSEDMLFLSFRLPSGTYATTVLREFLHSL